MSLLRRINVKHSKTTTTFNSKKQKEASSNSFECCPFSFRTLLLPFLTVHSNIKKNYVQFVFQCIDKGLHVLFMFVFIYAFWYPTRFLYHTMFMLVIRRVSPVGRRRFVLLNLISHDVYVSNTTGVTSGQEEVRITQSVVSVLYEIFIDNCFALFHLLLYCLSCFGLL